MLSDAVGVPDLLKRVGPILRGVLPWTKAEPAALELRRRVRVIVVGWVALVVPLLLLNMVFLLLNPPRMVATAWDSGARLVGVITTTSGLSVAAAVLQLIFLIIPVVGFGLTFLRLGRFLVGKAREFASGSTVKAVGMPLPLPLPSASLLSRGGPTSG